jgi:pilus assembly protein CpaB
VAKYALERGEPVGSENMALRAVPAEHLPASVIRPEQFDALAGLRLARPMRSGEPLLREALLDPAPEPLATRLQPGLRAVTVVADEVNSVSGMLRPGDRIDLLFSARNPQAIAQGESGESTRPLLQDVRVLATGGQLDSSRSTTPSARTTFGTITVEVTAEDAKVLVLAQRGGRLTALLRGQDDRFQIRTSPLDLTDLLGRPRPAPRVAPTTVAQGPRTEMIIGGVGRSGSAPSPQSFGVMPPPPAGTAEPMSGSPQRSPMSWPSHDRVTDPAARPAGSVSGFKPSLVEAGIPTALARPGDGVPDLSPVRSSPVVAVPHLIR